MRNKRVQVSLFDTYKEVADSYENNKPKLFRLLDERINWEENNTDPVFRRVLPEDGTPKSLQSCFVSQNAGTPANLRLHRRQSVTSHAALQQRNAGFLRINESARRGKDHAIQAGI